MSQKDIYKLTVIEEAESSISGKLLVITNPILGLNIITEDKTAQSGAIMAKIWNKALSWIRNQNPKIGNSLILGLGAGTVVNVIHSFWPNCRISGVEIDPAMIALGKKYFQLNNDKVNIVINDAYQYCLKQRNQRYDLILVDIFIGNKVPTKFEDKNFFKLVLQLLSKNGVAVFNRFFLKNPKTHSKDIARRLSKVFKNVIPLFSKRNVLFVCY